MLNILTVLQAEFQEDPQDFQGLVCTYFLLFILSKTKLGAAMKGLWR